MEANAAASDGLWMKIAKKATGIPTCSAPEALDVALCFGWIDGQRKANDEVSFLQRYCRRRPKSSWSKINVAKVEVLTAAGRMRPAGLAEVEAAQADGRWAAAYESQRLAEVPPDLMATLAVNARADRTFERLGKSDRYVLLLPLLKARTPEARTRIIGQLIKRLAAQEKGSGPDR